MGLCKSIKKGFRALMESHTCAYNTWLMWAESVSVLRAALEVFRLSYDGHGPEFY